MSLTLSCPGRRLVGVLSLAIHISPNNGQINMVSIAKWIYYVLPIHFARSIIQIRLLVAKLQLHYTSVAVGSSVAACGMTLGVYLSPPSASVLLDIYLLIYF